ncbi:16S rRNA (guanine(966)-N(2))-methyltransferase RsmD [Ideonella azotifigens]|uniref:16S rRNA (Guanine(966)-N(2))-methyltransferase RsmD n=1 Tax=Ideonella azotifigens TaxID=513160 RepID=A0ABN1K609_9BURK|nr:16S rRNA (guanine(966)-N(2))-methyltransferase RsmD [Ideonella azotifigens]MCD2342477.1 16S rRNA (guanine(966)-N(2))-methyltransferase RsmD [Ideonella azotifigens]
MKPPVTKSASKGGKPPAASPKQAAAKGAPNARHEVRIVGGQWRRSLLPVADKPGLRPTPDRVRETLFNWLGQDLSGWRVLDAFAGTGALGFEAASRGAAEVLLMEQDAALVTSLNASRIRLKAEAVLRVQRGDALAWLRGAAPQSLELVLLDPPFDSVLLAPALLAAARVVVPDGFVYVESGEALAEPLPDGLVLYRQGRAGAVHHALLQRVAEQPA